VLWEDSRLLLLQLILGAGGTGSTRLPPALSLRYLATALAAHFKDRRHWLNTIATHVESVMLKFTIQGAWRSQWGQYCARQRRSSPERRLKRLLLLLTAPGSPFTLLFDYSRFSSMRQCRIARRSTYCTCVPVRCTLSRRCTQSWGQDSPALSDEAASAITVPVLYWTVYRLQSSRKSIIHHMSQDGESMAHELIAIACAFYSNLTPCWLRVEAFPFLYSFRVCFREYVIQSQTKRLFCFRQLTKEPPHF
jgi:hypothetical protein